MGYDPNSLDVKHFEGSFAGYGTSYEIVNDKNGNPLWVDVNGSSSLKQIRYEPDGGQTFVPLHPGLGPITWTPSSNDFKSGALNALSSAAVDSKREVLKNFASRGGGSFLFDAVVADIKRGRFATLGSGAGLAVGASLLPVAVLSDMRNDGDSLGEAIIREAPAAVAGSAAGGTVGALVQGSLTGTEAGELGGLPGIVTGAVVGAGVGYLTSKGIEFGIRDGKLPHPDQLLMLPDDPAYLRAYIHDRSAAHPDWDLMGPPPPGANAKAFNAWRYEISTANQKLAVVSHPDQSIPPRQYYWGVDPETDSRYGITAENVDNVRTSPRRPTGKGIALPVGPSHPFEPPAEGLFTTLRRTLGFADGGEVEGGPRDGEGFLSTARPGLLFPFLQWPMMAQLAGQAAGKALIPQVFAEGGEVEEEHGPQDWDSGFLSLNKPGPLFPFLQWRSWYDIFAKTRSQVEKAVVTAAAGVAGGPAGAAAASFAGNMLDTFGSLSQQFSAPARTYTPLPLNVPSAAFAKGGAQIDRTMTVNVIKPHERPEDPGMAEQLRRRSATYMSHVR